MAYIKWEAATPKEGIMALYAFLHELMCSLSAPLCIHIAYKGKGYKIFIVFV
jgi:hypothetical protein